VRSFIICTLHHILLGYQIEEDEMGEACSAHGGDGKAYRILDGNLEGKKPLRRPRSRWEENIKMYRREIGWDGVDWIHLEEDRGR
jgi:hypothetical protein